MTRNSATSGPHGEMLIQFLKDPSVFWPAASANDHHDPDTCPPLLWKRTGMRRDLTQAWLKDYPRAVRCPGLTRRYGSPVVFSPKPTFCKVADTVDECPADCLSFVTKVPDAFAICPECKTLFCLEVENHNRLGSYARSHYTDIFWALDRLYWSLQVNVLDFRGNITPLTKDLIPVWTAFSKPESLYRSARRAIPGRGGAL